MCGPDVSFDFTLRDGRSIRIRPIRSDDKERLRAAFEALSPESRFRRFMGAKTSLSEKELRYLTEIDYETHVAWAAIDSGDPARPILGVARCVRLHPGSNVAEAAVAVVDAWHGLGVGTLLLGVLAECARNHGVDTFRAYVLPDNRAMLEIFEQLGGRRGVSEGGEVTIDVPLPRDFETLPNTPAGRVFKEVAKRTHPVLVHPLGSSQSS
jgi:GNAT superfamily N-acetyltransferase